MTDNQETTPEAPKFDVSAYPEGALFHDRRKGTDRRGSRAAGSGPAPERRARKERRRRIDPTTFEKQYTDAEMEFMTAMQRFKVQSGKAFPTHGEVLQVARALGYRRVAPSPDVTASSPWA